MKVEGGRYASQAFEIRRNTWRGLPSDFAILERDRDERTQGQKRVSGFAVAEFVISVSHIPQFVLCSRRVLASA